MTTSQVTWMHNALKLTQKDTFLDDGIEYLVKTGKPATGQVSIYFDSGALYFVTASGLFAGRNLFSEQ